MDADCFGTIGTTCDVATGICPAPGGTDAGATVDAGKPTPDAGTPTPDAGPTAQPDAGSTTAPDAGSPKPSSGGCGCNGLPGSADWSSVSLLLFALVELKRRR
jgi:hypothetical protein